MTLLPHLKIMFAALRKSGMRAVMASISVATTVAAILIAMGLSTGAQHEAEQIADQMGKNLFVIKLVKSRPLPGHGQGWFESHTLKENDVRALQQMRASIDTVVPVLEATRPVKFDRRSAAVVVRGVAPRFLALRNFKVERGRMLDDYDSETEARVALLGAAVAERLGNGANLLGEVVSIGGVPFEVVGILQAKGMSATGGNQDEQILVPIDTAQRRLFNADYYSSLLVQAASAAAMPQAQAESTAVLRVNHRLGDEQRNDFELLDLIKTNQMRERNSTFLRGTSLLFAAITLLVSIVGVLAVAYLNVKDRTGEIGLRIAIGAKRRNIVLLFVSEAVVLSVVGGLIGIAFGFVGIAILHFLTDWRMAIDLLDVLVPFVCSACVGVLAGVLPAIKASRMLPVEALRSA